MRMVSRPAPVLASGHPSMKLDHNFVLVHRLRHADQSQPRTQTKASSETLGQHVRGLPWQRNAVWSASGARRIGVLKSDLRHLWLIQIQFDDTLMEQKARVVPAWLLLALGLVMEICY
jgi:hypothetical protein